MKKLIKLMLAIVLLLVMASCGKPPAQEITTKQSTQPPQNSTADTALSSTEAQIDEPYAKALLQLKDGNTKPLVGYAFGDPFDYDLFEISGYSGDTMYRLKGAEGRSISFFFSGKENSFSGLAAFLETDFFGVTSFVDSIDKIKRVLGEPDEYYEAAKADDADLSVYSFEKAVMEVWVYPTGIIQYIKYQATEKAFEGLDFSDETTDYLTDLKTKHSYAETIYSQPYDKLDQACYYPYEEGYSEKQKAAFITAYLEKRGADKNTPYEVTYNAQGEPLAECYKSRDGRLLFVVHRWGKFWEDYEAGIGSYTDAIYCAALPLNKETKAGNIIYNIGPKRGAVRERLYDAQGKRMAHISYEYVSGVPVPFVTEHWNTDTGFPPVNTALCRNQKMWMYRDLAEFDKAGKFLRYNGSGGRAEKDYLCFPCTAVHDANGRLKLLEEEMPENWDENDTTDFPAQINFKYRKNGNVDLVEYERSFRYGTYDATGDILYDAEGRMIYNEYYVTSGHEITIHLYQDGEEMPWARLDWSSFGNGFGSIYVFQK